jgi:C4-dicarboxylate-binding protein DctP
VQVITLTPDQKRSWKKAMVKVHKELEDKIGKDLIHDIYKETGFDPAKL